MPRRSPPQSLSPVPPPTRCLRQHRITPTTSLHRASTTMPATPLPRPYRPFHPSYRQLRASPRSLKRLPRLTVPRTRLASIHPARGGTAGPSLSSAVCSLRPSEHRIPCRPPTRTSRSPCHPSQQPCLRPSTQQDRACRSLRPRRSPRRTLQPQSYPPATRPFQSPRHRCLAASATSSLAIREPPRPPECLPSPNPE